MNEEGAFPFTAKGNSDLESSGYLRNCPIPACPECEEEAVVARVRSALVLDASNEGAGASAAHAESDEEGEPCSASDKVYRSYQR